MKLPFLEAVFGKKYWKSTVIAMITTMYSQQSAANVFTMYSNRIMTDMNAGVTDASKMISANDATIWLGIISFVSTCFSTLTVRRFKRKELLIAG